ncbi:MAG: TlpA disulfide reductase family protein [Candidatus Nitrosopolaris sp.]
MSKTTSSKSKTTITIAAIITVLIISVAAAGSVKIAYSQSSNTRDFSLKTLDGKQVSLESFKGKPLLLWFMATWCPTCVGQVGAIKQVTSEYGNKLNVLVIDMWAAQNIGQSAQGLDAETSNDLQAFLAKYGSPQWSAALDTNRVTIKYGITQVDSTVVVDGNGKIVFTNLGPSGYQPLKDALTKVVV